MAVVDVHRPIAGKPVDQNFDAWVKDLEARAILFVRTFVKKKVKENDDKLSSS